MQYVHPAPRHVAKKVRIASKEGRLHALHHEQAGADCRQPGQHDYEVIQLVLQRILPELSRLRSGLSHGASDSSRSIFYVLSVRPDGPKVQPKGRVENVINDGDGQNDPRDPVVSDPGKLDTHLREESGEKQRQHGDRHDQVEEASAKRMSRDALGNMSEDSRGNRRRIRMRGSGLRLNVYRMDDQEQQSPDCGHPQKAPGNVDRDLLTPRTLRPLYEVQAASCPPTPRIARFTRFRINGTLYPLCCSGMAPRTASCPASSAVSAFRGFPCTAASTAVSRAGRGAAPMQSQ